MTDKLTDNEIVKALNTALGMEHISIYCANIKNEVHTVKVLDIIDLINRIQAENERLKAEICGQKEANLFLINDKENAINGAIKKFCNIFKKRINNEPLVFFEQRHIVYDEIDNLLKELVGE